MEITDILVKIEETDMGRVDKCIIYSDIVMFLKNFRDNFEVHTTGDKIKDFVAQAIVKELKSQCEHNIDEVKNFIALNLIK